MKITKKEAKKLAKKLIERLIKEIGGSWESRVWENLGWHYSAILGTMSVSAYHRNNKIYYSCLISDGEHLYTGLAAWSVSNDISYTNPVTAVKEAMQASRNYADELTRVVLTNEDLLR